MKVIFEAKTHIVESKDQWYVRVTSDIEFSFLPNKGDIISIANLINEDYSNVDFSKYNRIKSEDIHPIDSNILNIESFRHSLRYSISQGLMNNVEFYVNKSVAFKYGTLYIVDNFIWDFYKNENPHLTISLKDISL